MYCEYAFTSLFCIILLGAFEVLRLAQDAGYKADCKLYTTLISTCAKSGKVDTMFEVRLLLSFSLRGCFYDFIQNFLNNVLLCLMEYFFFNEQSPCGVHANSFIKDRHNTSADT